MQDVPSQIYIAIGAFVLLGLALTWMGFRRLFHRRFFAGGTVTLSGLVLLLLAVVTVGVLANLYTYHRLTAEQLVGTLAFREYEGRKFVASFTPYNGRTREFNIIGDQCQLDARILKWRGPATLLGLHPVYRLERLSGRYADASKERDGQRSVHELAEKAGIEFWDLVNQYNNWLPWVDAIYGNAVYLPMRNSAEFRISITYSGLVARPTNKAAQRAIKNWK